MAALAQPVFAGGGGGGIAGGGGGGGGAAGGGGGVAGGAGAGTATSAAATTTVSATTAISSVAATVSSVGISAATSVVANVAVPIAIDNKASEQQTGSAPLNPPGGAITVIEEDDKQAALSPGKSSVDIAQTNFTPPGTTSYAEFVKPADRALTRFGGGAVPLTAAGSMWAIGALTHNDKVARTGQLATRAVFTAEALAGGMKLGTQLSKRNTDNPRSFVSANAMRTFALASVIRSEYRDKPLVVIGAYGYATAVSLSGIGAQRRSPSEVIVGAVIGELIGRFITHRNSDER